MKDKISKTDQEWRTMLSAKEFEITRKKGTEPAFTGKLNDHKADGMYYCKCCSAELFSSRAKYDSGSGWPSFYQSITKDAIDDTIDHSHGMKRIEVTCSRCDAHLGHVFEDGPAPTGLRYCINSASLAFKNESDSNS